MATAARRSARSARDRSLAIFHLASQPAKAHLALPSDRASLGL
jgi:hypothetical protein